MLSSFYSAIISRMLVTVHCDISAKQSARFHFSEVFGFSGYHFPSFFSSFINFYIFSIFRSFIQTWQHRFCLDWVLFIVYSSLLNNFYTFNVFTLYKMFISLDFIFAYCVFVVLNFHYTTGLFRQFAWWKTCKNQDYEWSTIRKWI